MSDARRAEGRIRPVAEESLETFDGIAKAARAKLLSGTPSGSAAGIARNSWTDTEAIRNRARIDQENLDGYKTLSREPAIARVVVADEDGKRITYYFSRAAADPPYIGQAKFASYRAPVGRLAELRVGEEYELPRGGAVKIVEHARFLPFLKDQEWNAREAVLEGEDYGPLSVDSFRAIIGATDEIDETTLDELLSEEMVTVRLRDGVRRAVISKMDLRDQPVLDRYQGDIFRMPLNRRLLILGAPGTGKTTTLIRRLGQKLDVAFLDDDERQLIGAISETDHAESWIMFTPTELLRLYVKEAFNREGIPAPDERIRTWSVFRDNLARNYFRILRSATSSSSLVMRDGAQTLTVDLEVDQTAWFDDFDRWQKSAFWEELRNTAGSLSEGKPEDVAKLGKRVLFLIDAAGPAPQASTFASLMGVAEEIRALLDSMKEATDGKIRRQLTLLVNRDRQFLDDMAAFISELGDTQEDEADADADEEEEASQPRVGRAAALAAYMRTMRTLARARAQKRSVPKTSASGRLLDWLGDRKLDEQDLPELGESLIVQGALRTFVNPVRRYVDQIPARYRRFRRARQGEGKWYRSDGISPTEVHPLEVDVILLAMLRATDGLIAGARALADLDTPGRAVLDRMTQLYRTQVLVDEATDFSPVQLACMATLARPESRSFFACGDFNQRVTRWGTRSGAEMKWVLPDIATRTVTIAYRQSNQLHGLARQLVVLSGGRDDDAILPAFTENEGFQPVLVEGISAVEDAATWLAERILEIERIVRELPSIAVLVNSEEEVSRVAEALGVALVEHNVSVEACPNGRVRGNDGSVRVFNVEHIKGLEFEAVFFVGVDRLAEKEPDLFDKYLYVGATRAATYLGLTCEAALPPRMAPLRERFGKDWS